MTIDPLLVARRRFGVGIVVGLTGMGGGALMTPVLVLFFNSRRSPRSPATWSPAP